jgi:hypothetical protein
MLLKNGGKFCQQRLEQLEAEGAGHLDNAGHEDGLVAEKFSKKNWCF